MVNQLFCSGIGQFHTNEADPSNPDKKLKPYNAINLEGIRKLVDKPQEVDKALAQWLIPSILPSRNFKKQEGEGSYYLLWLDLDEEPLPIYKVKKHLKSIIGHCQFEIYTSKSATEENQKARVLIPLKKSLTGNEWRVCQEVLNDSIDKLDVTPDRANERPAQLCYLPNKGKFYKSMSEREGDLFDPMVVFSCEIEKKRLAIVRVEQQTQARHDKAKQRKADLKYTGSESSHLIDAFNEAYTVEDILLQAGYRQKGDKFCHPNSSSGSYAVSIKDNRVHSLSSSDPLYSDGKGSHDAFSAFTELFNGMSTSEALMNAGDNWLEVDGDSWNKIKQGEYAKNKADEKQMLSNEASSTDKEEALFDFSKYSIIKDIDDMKKNMLEEVHIMKDIAILGQITVFYARPNTGKTLLCLHLLIEAIKEKKIVSDDVYYVNVDDNYNGLIEKAEIAKNNGFHMMGADMNDFKVRSMAGYMEKMIKQGSAKGKIIILDTLKKFAELMDKKDSSQFMKTARSFSTHGGSLIMLAHTNKNRNGEGKAVHGGTSDIVDDSDCAFIIDEISQENEVKTISFENIKLRGNVAKEVFFTYSTKQQPYRQLLDSIKRVDDMGQQKEAIKKMGQMEQDSSLIKAITNELTTGSKLKTPLIESVHKITKISKPKIKAVLNSYEGKHWAEHKAEKNSIKYELI